MSDLPPDWKNVKFDDVVREVREYDKEPLKNGITRYVGLDHLDPRSLQIKRWGNIAEGTTFTKKFTKGQILFGRRRAYQRKTAIAAFQGLCSGDIMVFTNKDGLIPELLPFIVQSEAFYNYALDTSAGSLSPRTKWKHLSKFEFPLPPLDVQKCIAEILWGVEDAIRKVEESISQGERYKRVLIRHLFTYGTVGIKDSQKISLKKMEMGLVNKKWKISTINDVTLKTDQCSPSKYPEKEILYVDVSSVSNELFQIINYHKYKGKDAPSRARKIIFHDDIIFATVRPYLLRIAMVPKTLHNEVCSTAFCVLRASKDKILPEYLFNYILSSRFIGRISAFQTGTTYPAVTDRNVKNRNIPIPDIDEQRLMVKIFKAIDQIKKMSKMKLESLTSLMHNLLNDLLSGEVVLGGDTDG